MPRDADFTPDPACMIIIKDDDLYIMSSLYSAYAGRGHAYHDVLAKHSLSDFVATPREVGRAVRAAWERFYIVPRKEDEPKGDSLRALGRKLRGRSLRGAREVMVRRDGDTIKFTGSFAFAAWGFENLDKCTAAVPAESSDEAVGQALLDLLKKMKRRVSTWPS